MPASLFFQKKGPFCLGDLAGAVGAVCPPEHVSKMIDDVAPLEAAGPSHMSFWARSALVNNSKYKDHLAVTKAGAVLMRAESVAVTPAGTVPLVAADPHKAYALAAQMFYPVYDPPVPLISDRAVVDPSAKLGLGCRVEAGAVIAAGAELDDGVWVEPNAVIGENVKIGAGSRVGANASVSYALVGKRVRIYPGARIGQDGFGFAIDPKGFVKVPQLGRVIIEDGCEIGANTCIDRGSGPDTVIGAGTWIDNLVQIGHNVKVGKGCILVSQVGIAGSTIVEDYVAMGGQVGVAGHLTIGSGAQIAAKSGVMSNVEPKAVMMGYPAERKTQFMRSMAALRRLARGKKMSGETTEL